MTNQTKKKEKQATIEDVLVSINQFSTQMDEKFSKMDMKFGKIDEKFSKMDRKFATELKKLEIKLMSKLATKDFVEETASKYHAKSVLLMRKEDKKLKTLVNTLYKKKALTKSEKELVLALEPFSQIA